MDGCLLVLQSKAKQPPNLSAKFIPQHLNATSLPPLLSSPSMNDNTGIMWICVLLLYLFFLLTSFSVPHSATCSQSDHDSLLTFFSAVSSPSPLNWSSTSDCCDWEGIHCDSVSGRVTELSLPNRTLNGTLPPSIPDLTFLSLLNLTRNRISGNLPSGFFASMSNLRFVDLSLNGFSGVFPALAPGSSLHTLDISGNKFAGTLPGSIFQLGQKLTVFNSSNNNFLGLIPSPICDPSNPNSSITVTSLDFSYNNFSGQLPSGIGNCSKLRIFRAGSNSLSGELPDEIYGATSLQELSLFINQLTGPIGDGISNLTDLKILALYFNNLTGPIPSGIGNLSQLQELLLHINNLTGSLPSSLQRCINMKKLFLRVNRLSGDITDFDFSPMQQLTILDLGNNNFTGKIPQSLYSCKSLAAIRFASNSLKGEILPDIINLQSLSFISVSNNSLSNIAGALTVLTNCKSLTTVILTYNFYNEVMPTVVDPNGFPNLQILAMGGCLLRGEIPSWLQNLKNLEVLDLSQNQITGPIPDWFSTLPDLFYIDLSSNQLTGNLPTKLTDLLALQSGQLVNIPNQTFLELPVFVMPSNATNQQYNQLNNLPPAIYLSNNTLTGTIPPEIGRLKGLHVLDLHLNGFSGSIPNEISNLVNLEVLDLSWNVLTGSIPSSLKNLHFLSSFNVAHNKLEGVIPSGGQFDTFTNSSYVGNDKLCGLPLKSCSNQSGGGGGSAMMSGKTNRRVLIGLVLGICLAMFLIVVPFSIWIASKQRVIPRRDSEDNGIETMSINTNFGFTSELDKDTSLVMVFQDNIDSIKSLTIHEILKATENFNQANIIGCGAFGLVYKATLSDGANLAVKKLSGDMGLLEREFKAEVEVLSNARHENLVALQGYCIHDGARLLIYSFMENGSLDYWLHERPDGPTHLDWPMRLKIAQGASRGLAYMHLVCNPHIVHRDIKSSNILLDEHFEAHVADFGLSRLILPYHTHVTTELVGTLGYIPPEYAHAWIATLRGDVYSFGVVLLELLTGKRPVEVTKPKESRELVGWVNSMRRLEGKENEIFEPVIRGKGYEEEMVQVLDVACLCVSMNPFKRPTIQEVVDCLSNVGGI